MWANAVAIRCQKPVADSLPIDFPAVADTDDDNDQDGVVNLIDDARIANAHAMGVFLTAHLLDAVRARSSANAPISG